MDGRALFKVLVFLLALACLAVALKAVSDSIIQNNVGDIDIAPQGGLTFNTTMIQMRSPDGTWSCCGPNAEDTWTCTAGECT